MTERTPFSRRRLLQSASCGFGYLAFSGLAQGGLIGPLTRRFGEGWVVVGATLLLATGMLGVALAQSLALLLFAVACLAGGFGLSNPALQSLVSRLSKEGTTGGALGITQSASSLARVSGPPLAGFLFENYGHNAPYLFGGLMMLGVLGLASVLRLRLAREEAGQSKARPRRGKRVEAAPFFFSLCCAREIPPLPCRSGARPVA